MVRLVAKRSTVIVAALLAGSLLLGCAFPLTSGYRRPLTKARLTVATLNCAMLADQGAWPGEVPAEAPAEPQAPAEAEGPSAEEQVLQARIAELEDAYARAVDLYEAGDLEGAREAFHALAAAGAREELTLSHATERGLRSYIGRIDEEIAEATTEPVELVPIPTDAQAEEAEEPAEGVEEGEGEPQPEAGSTEATEEEAEEKLDPRLVAHLDRIARLIKETDADVLALQGISSVEALDHLQAALKELRWRPKYRGYAFFGEERGELSGIVVMSKFPFLSFLPLDVEPEGPLAHSEIMEARIQLPRGQELVLFNFRLHQNRSVQMEEATALHDLTLPLRRPEVNLMLAGCLSCPDPYQQPSAERSETPASVLAGTRRTPLAGQRSASGQQHLVDVASYRTDLIDLHGYLWPRERATCPEGGQCCRILVSPELTADTYRREDWYLTGVEIVGDEETDACGHRAVVAHFSLR